MKTVFNVSQYVICMRRRRAYELFAAPGPFMLARIADPWLRAGFRASMCFTLGAVSLSWEGL